MLVSLFLLLEGRESLSSRMVRRLRPRLLFSLSFRRKSDGFALMPLIKPARLMLF